MGPLIGKLLPYALGVSAVVLVGAIGTASWALDQKEKAETRLAYERVRRTIAELGEWALEWRSAEEVRIVERIEYRDRIIEQEASTNAEFAACERQLLPAGYVDSLWDNNAPDAP